MNGPVRRLSIGLFAGFFALLLAVTWTQVIHADVLKAVPWFKDAGAVVGAGRSRPLSRDYGQVSDVIRTSTSAALARTKKPEEAVAEIESRLRRVMR